MTMTKKTTKRLLAFVMMAVMAISMLSMEAFAAGTETWYGNYVSEDTMTIRNNNLTPVKTMGVSGKLHICASVSGRPDLEPANCPKVQLTVQIRDLNGNVLVQRSVREDDFMAIVDLEINVTKGQKVQIFFDVSSVEYNPNGNYRIADVGYSHEIY